MTVSTHSQDPRQDPQRPGQAKPPTTGNRPAPPVQQPKPNEPKPSTVTDPKLADPKPDAPKPEPKTSSTAVEPKPTVDEESEPPSLAEQPQFVAGKQVIFPNSVISPNAPPPPAPAAKKETGE
jgi:hypothetical protein